MAVGHLLALRVLGVRSTQSSPKQCLPAASQKWVGIGLTAEGIWVFVNPVIVSFLTLASSSSPFHPGFVLLFG